MYFSSSYGKSYLLYGEIYACDLESLEGYINDVTTQLEESLHNNLDAVDRVAQMISNTTVRVKKYTVSMFQECGEDRYKNISFDYVEDYAIAYLHAEHPEDDWNSTKLQEMLDLLYNGDSLLYYLSHTLGSPSASITIVERVKKMIERYITVGSENEINISGSLKKEVIAEFNNPNLNEGILEKVDEEIVSLIVQNCGNSFLACTYASKAKDMLMWFRGFEEMNNEQKDAVIEKIVEHYIDSKQNSDNKFKNTVFTTKEEADLALAKRPKSVR